MQQSSAYSMRNIGIMIAIMSLLGCLKPTSKEKNLAGVVECTPKLNLESYESAELVGDLDEIALEEESSTQFALLAGEFYEPQVKAEMTGKCATSGCHNGTTGPRLTTYAEVKAAFDAVLLTISPTPAKPMPQGSSNATGRAALTLIMNGWKANNYLERAPGGPAPTPVPTAAPTAVAGAVTFNGQLRSLLQTKCGGGSCHPAIGGIDIASEVWTKENFEMMMEPVRLSAGTSGIMPPGGKLAASDMKLLEDWKAGGFVVGVVASPNAGQSSDAECLLPVLSEVQKKAVQLLMFPEGMKACTDLTPKQFFKRKEKECLADSALVSETCDKSWVGKVSAKAVADKKKEIEDKLAAGWVPEQCATVVNGTGSDNLFYLVKIEISGGTPTLQSNGYRIPN